VPATLLFDRIGELVMAAATVAAVVLLALTLPALIRLGRGGRRPVTPALVVLTAAAAITFVSYVGFFVRCADSDSGCGYDSGDTFAGFSPWWRTDDAWQWGAQLALAGVALVLASLALFLAVRKRRAAGRAVAVARVAVFIWALVAFLIPALWEIVLI
jgi:hypothetical protein